MSDNYTMMRGLQIINEAIEAKILLESSELDELSDDTFVTIKVKADKYYRHYSEPVEREYSGALLPTMLEMANAHGFGIADDIHDDDVEITAADIWGSIEANNGDGRDYIYYCEVVTPDGSIILADEPALDP